MTPSPSPADVRDDTVGLRLGAHIRALRKLRGLTLVQLAAATELSHPFLSQLERGLAQPSLGSLRRIAVALETSPIEIIAAAEAAETGDGGAEVHRHGEGAVPDGFASGTARMLSHRSQAFHPLEVESDELTPGEYFVHAEEEFLYVVEGTVRVDLDGEAHVLTARESMYYPGGTRHRWWSEDGGPYRLLVVKQALRGASRQDTA